MSRTRRLFTAVSILLITLVFAVSMYAQSRRADTTNDLATHKFHPKTSLIVSGDVTTQTAVTTIQPSAIAEMQALLQAKRERTATQRKIDGNVLATTRMMQGKPVANGITSIETYVDLDANDNLVLDITAYVSNGLLDRMRQQGVNIIGSWPQYREIRASVPADKVETIAAFPEVIFVSAMRDATTWREEKREARANSVKSYLSNVMPLVATTAPGTGAQVSEGDKTHKADVARATYGVSGAGIKIGVLSDGVNNLAVSQALGELGPVTVIEGQAGDGDEGTAMLEIIHDLAPSAKLYFATAWPTSANFASNIKKLREAGCDIIVDDVSYYVETRFQDGQDPEVISTTNQGIVVQAVNDVVADGAFYFSSAANSGNKDDQTSGTWEGDFVNGGFIPNVGYAHLFGTTTFNRITGKTGPLVLTWADPIGASTNDYDIFLLNSTATGVVLSSLREQSIEHPGDPVEYIGAQVPPGYLIVVVKYDSDTQNTAPRYLHLSTNRGVLENSTFGASYGHNASKQAFGVAATPARWPFGDPAKGWPIGPFPEVFSATGHVELFSSDGPRRIFFNADGTPLTAGNFSSTGGTALNKPDFTAADGVSVTGLGDFGSPFYGTSAAAPHAAAIAALIKSARPTITSAGMKGALANTAIDIQGSGWDRNSGTGIIMADAAIASLGTNANANPDLGTVLATENPGNANGAIEPGEGVKLVVPLHNKLGATAATAIKAKLTTATPGVIITEPSTVTYANLAAKADAANGSAPFLFTLASDFPPCATSIDFEVSVEYTGGPSPRVLSFSIPVGPQPIILSHNLGDTPATVTGFTTGKGMQDGRVSRNTVSTTCATTPKAFPGVYGAGALRNFDSYTFTACRDTCAAFSVGDAQQAFFTNVYSGTFDPTNIATNFIADAGSTFTSQSFSAQLTQGTSYTVVVNEVNPDAGKGKPYTMSLPGCAVSCAPVNNVPTALAKDVTVDANPLKLVAVNVNNGSFDLDNDIVSIKQTPASPYPIGTTDVVLTVVDSKGATSQANAKVTVRPIPTVTSVKLISPATGNPTFGPVTAEATVVAGFGSDNTGSIKFTIDGTTTSPSIPMGERKTATWTFIPSVGTHSIVAEYSGDQSYALSTSAALPITVDTAPSQILLTTSKPSIAFGQSVTFTASITNITGGAAATGNVDFMEGTTVLGTSALNSSGVATFTTTALAKGSHSVTASYAGDATYPATVTGTAITQVVTDADFSLGSNPGTLTITRGNTGSVTITVTPIGTFAGTITLACGTLPQYATCSFSPATVSPTTAAVTSVLTINTKAATSATLIGHTMPIYAMLSLVLPGLLVIPARKNRKAKYMLWTLLFVLAIVVLIGTVGCGSSSTPAPAAPAPLTTAAGTYSIPVTVSGGNQTHNLNISLTVQ